MTMEKYGVSRTYIFILVCLLIIVFVIYQPIKEISSVLVIMIIVLLLDRITDRRI